VKWSWNSSQEARKICWLVFLFHILHISYSNLIKPMDRLSWQRFRCFICSFHADVGVVYYVRPWPLRFVSFQIYFSLVNKTFHSLQFELLTASWTKP
jgi:hypothetical protein